jgi:hypothetical protein
MDGQAGAETTGRKTQRIYPAEMVNGLINGGLDGRFLGQVGDQKEALLGILVLWKGFLEFVEVTAE